MRPARSTTYDRLLGSAASGDQMTSEAFPLLVNLADRGLVRILDLVFVRKEIDESVVAPELKGLNGEGELDLSVFEEHRANCSATTTSRKPVMCSSAQPRDPGLRQRLGGAVCRIGPWLRWPARRQRPDSHPSSALRDGRHQGEHLTPEGTYNAVM
jgi:hypothetical protein